MWSLATLTTLVALTPGLGLADPCLDRMRAADQQPPAAAVASLDAAAADTHCAELADLLRFRALEIARAQAGDPCALAQRADAFVASAAAEDDLRSTASKWAAEHRRACDAAREAPPAVAPPPAKRRPKQRAASPEPAPAAPPVVAPTTTPPAPEPPAAPAEKPTEQAPSAPVDTRGSITDPPEPASSALTSEPDAPPPPDEDGTVYLWTGVAITSAVGSVILWGWGVDAAAERDDAWSQWRDHPTGSPAESATLRRFRDARLEALGYFICGSLATGLAATATGFALHGWLTADEDLEVAPGPGGISVRGRF